MNYQKKSTSCLKNQLPDKKIFNKSLLIVYTGCNKRVNMVQNMPV